MEKCLDGWEGGWRQESGWMTGSEVDQDGEPNRVEQSQPSEEGLMRMERRRRRRRRRRSSCLTVSQTDGSEARRGAPTETVKV